MNHSSMSSLRKHDNIYSSKRLSAYFWKLHTYKLHSFLKHLFIRIINKCAHTCGDHKEQVPSSYHVFR